MTAPKTFSHIGVTVTDIEKATRWYEKVLGCHVIMPPMEAKEDGSHFAALVADFFGKGFKRVRIAHLGTAEGIGIELFQFDKPKTTLRKPNFDYARTGIFHLCIVDPDIERLVKAIAKSGGKQRSKIWNVWPDKPYRTCYCEDPWGNIVEVNTHGFTQTWANFFDPHKR